MVYQPTKITTPAKLLKSQICHCLNVKIESSHIITFNQVIVYFLSHNYIK